MLAFILRRLLQSIAVLLTVGLVAFSLFRYVGDPINAMVGQDTSMEQREELRTKLGLNDPAPIQFFRFIANAARGNFGLSYRTSEPVSRMIINRHSFIDINSLIRWDLDGVEAWGEDQDMWPVLTFADRQRQARAG